MIIKMKDSQLFIIVLSFEFRDPPTKISKFSPKYSYFNNLNFTTSLQNWYHNNETSQICTYSVNKAFHGGTDPRGPININTELIGLTLR
jgi:hypothetical protein